MLVSPAPLDDDGAIPNAAKVTALRFSISSLAIGGGRVSLTGLALVSVRFTRFAVVVVVAVFILSMIACLHVGTRPTRRYNIARFPRDLHGHDDMMTLP